MKNLLSYCIFMILCSNLFAYDTNCSNSIKCTGGMACSGIPRGFHMTGTPPAGTYYFNMIHTKSNYNMVTCYYTGLTIEGSGFKANTTVSGNQWWPNNDGGFSCTADPVKCPLTNV